MNETHDLLHVARPRECGVQHPAPSGATTPATPRATTPLRAAALRVLARNKACNNRATAAEKPVQQTPAATGPFVASNSLLADQLAELNGLVARLARWGGIGASDTAGAQVLTAGSVDELLRGLRRNAEHLPLFVDDDRITCRQCTRVVGELCRLDARAISLDQPRRCRSYAPRQDATDQRSGRERWPWAREVGS
jgi:hypothetical protein